MAKLNETAATELPLNDERLPEKKNRHIVIAQRHLLKRKGVLLTQISKLHAEVNSLDAAIEALE